MNYSYDKPLVKDHILNVITSCDVECSSNCEDPAITGASLLLHDDT